jgi:hypothetical protein
MSVSRRSVVAVFAAAALGLGGGVAASAAPSENTAAVDTQASPGEVWKRTELYFGTTQPGGEVSDTEFTVFSDKVITPAFPDGFTELTGRGQWRGSDGVITREKSKVIVVVYPFSDRDANREIEEIRAEYKKQFQQESVLRTDSVEKVSF